MDVLTVLRLLGREGAGLARCLVRLTAYVYLATISLAGGCAYGAPAGYDPGHMFGDSGLGHDAGVASVHDAGKPPPDDAAVTSDDSGDRPDTTTTTCSLSLPTGNPLCDSCLSSFCCTEDTACGNDPDCMNFINCTGACFPSDGGPPDQTCVNGCTSQYPNGSNELMNLDQCLGTSCVSSCP